MDKLKEIVDQMREDLNGYNELLGELEVKDMRKAGEIEEYGTYLGKKETLEDLIPKLAALI
jgi:hypothetical protein